MCQAVGEKAGVGGGGGGGCDTPRNLVGKTEIM